MSFKNNKYKTIKETIDYDKLINSISFTNRELYISSITPVTADKIEMFIRYWNNIDENAEIPVDNRPVIKIFINCLGGGSLSAAFTMIDSIKLSRTPIKTINTGVCYKEALYVYLAASKRYAYPRSSFMYKKDLKAFDVEDNTQSNYDHFCELQAEELKSMLEEKTKMSNSELDKDIIWYTAEKAYELRICQEVTRSRSIEMF